MRDPIEHAVTNVALIMALLSAEEDDNYDDYYDDDYDDYIDYQEIGRDECR